MPFVTDKVADRPIILTSTTLTQREYGACLTKLKERLGLRGNQDLYVLINVTMSPWPTTTDLLTKMTGEFQDVVDKLVDVRHMPPRLLNQQSCPGYGIRTNKYLVLPV